MPQGNESELSRPRRAPEADDHIGRLISAALNGVDQPTPAMNEFIDELMSQEPPLTEEEESALADRVRARFESRWPGDPST